MNARAAAVVTGVGLAMPGNCSAADLLSRHAEGAEPVDPAALIGRKGLRYKDRATQLAMCAADAALRDARLLGADGLALEPESIGVVVASNFGNLDTITKIVATIANEQGAQGLSPMDTPNASSNVIASTVAIRFGLRGPNLTVCNGATSGLDGIRWASGLMAAGRADRILVIGVEPDTDAVRRLLDDRPPIDGAVAIVVETPTAARRRHAPAQARIGTTVRAGGTAQALGMLGDQAPAAWYAPEDGAATPPDSTVAGIPRHDLTQRWGIASGALGVLQCAAAIGSFAAGCPGPVYVVAGGDGDDASAALVLLGPEPAAPAAPESEVAP